MPNYAIFIQFDEVDNIFVASVPDLPGCMAHGDTPEQALQEIIVAQKLWIEVAIEDGEKLPEPKIHAI